MNGIRTLAAVGTMLAALVAFAPAALAHSTGHESRSAADCEKLPGTAKDGERGGCLACVSRKGKFHFHPDAAAGKRCKRDNGKP